MSKSVEELYIASCPFCRYRQLFSSGIAMVVTYGTHLSGHEEAARGQAFGPDEAGEISPAQLEEHARKLRAARFN